MEYSLVCLGSLSSINSSRPGTGKEAHKLCWPCHKSKRNNERTEGGVDAQASWPTRTWMTTNVLICTTGVSTILCTYIIPVPLLPVSSLIPNPLLPLMAHSQLLPSPLFYTEYIQRLRFKFCKVCKVLHRLILRTVTD